MKRKIASLFTACAVLMTAAACGSGDDSSSGGDGEIKVGSFPGTIFTYPLTVAEKKGFFVDEDLEVKLVDGKSGPEILSAMIGGSTDIRITARITSISGSPSSREVTTRSIR